LRAAGLSEVHAHENIAAAYDAARGDAAENDRIVIFGSFVTVAEVLQRNTDAHGR
jgi:dihydrofolate synthase / folylpolyglutamate synthase